MRIGSITYTFQNVLQLEDFMRVNRLAYFSSDRFSGTGEEEFDSWYTVATDGTWANFFEVEFLDNGQVILHASCSANATDDYVFDRNLQLLSCIERFERFREQRRGFTPFPIWNGEVKRQRRLEGEFAVNIFHAHKANLN